MQPLRLCVLLVFVVAVSASLAYALNVTALHGVFSGYNSTLLLSHVEGVRASIFSGYNSTLLGSLVVAREKLVRLVYESSVMNNVVGASSRGVGAFYSFFLCEERVYERYVALAFNFSADTVLGVNNAYILNGSGAVAGCGWVKGSSWIIAVCTIPPGMVSGQQNNLTVVVEGGWLNPSEFSLKVYTVYHDRVETILYSVSGSIPYEDNTTTVTAGGGNVSATIVLGDLSSHYSTVTVSCGEPPPWQQHGGGGGSGGGGGGGWGGGSGGGVVPGPGGGAGWSPPSLNISLQPIEIPHMNASSVLATPSLDTPEGLVSALALFALWLALAARLGLATGTMVAMMVFAVYGEITGNGALMVGGALGFALALLYRYLSGSA